MRILKPLRQPLSDPLDISDIDDDQLPSWARWNPSAPYTLGVEEEAMVLDCSDWSLAGGTEDFLKSVPRDLAAHLSAETHEAAIEITGAPHREVGDVAEELRILRESLQRESGTAHLCAASAGTHPLAVWQDIRVSGGARYQLIYESMRELARREPTFALHVHVGVPDPQSAIILLNRLRAHLPLLLALSVNSPFWQGRDTGLASARIPIFQSFPRVGIPLAFCSYLEYVEVVDQLIRCEAFPEPSFLWWDVRLRPLFGTVEVRVMDAQSTVERSATLAGLVQAIAHLELEEGYHDASLISASEILDENRFLAARDGMSARLLDPVRETRVGAEEQLDRLLDAVRPHAQELGGEAAIDAIAEMAHATGAQQQRQMASKKGLTGVLQMLLATFIPS